MASMIRRLLNNEMAKTGRTMKISATRVGLRTEILTRDFSNRTNGSIVTLAANYKIKHNF